MLYINQRNFENNIQDTFDINLTSTELNLRLGGAKVYSNTKPANDIDMCQLMINIFCGYNLNLSDLMDKVNNPRYRAISEDYR
jgi:hypothetical protein